METSGFKNMLDKLKRRLSGAKSKLDSLHWQETVIVISTVLLILLAYNVSASKRGFAQMSQQVSAAEADAELSAAADVADTDEAPQTEPDIERVILPQYEQLHADNADFYGWLSIDGTKIDYPVMYSPDEPGKYLYGDFNGNYSLSGTPFLDELCSPDSDNLLIYAHNMLDGSMFKGLLGYEKQNFCAEHPVIVFNTLYEQQEFEVLAAFYDEIYQQTDDCFKFYQFIDAENEDDFNYAISQFKEKALYDTGVTAEYGQQLITLITCTYQTENGRFVVVAREKAQQ